MNIIDTLMGLFETSGIGAFFNGTASIKNIIMILVACVFLYLAIAKKFEPLQQCRLLKKAQWKPVTGMIRVYCDCCISV